MQKQAAPCGISARPLRLSAALKIQEITAQHKSVKAHKHIDSIGCFAHRPGTSAAGSPPLHDICMTGRGVEKTPSNNAFEFD